MIEKDITDIVKGARFGEHNNVVKLTDLHRTEYLKHYNRERGKEKG